MLTAVNVLGPPSGKSQIKVTEPKKKKKPTKLSGIQAQRQSLNKGRWRAGHLAGEGVLHAAKL